MGQKVGGQVNLSYAFSLKDHTPSNLLRGITKFWT